MKENDIAVNEHNDGYSYIFKIDIPSKNWAIGKNGFIRVKTKSWGNDKYSNSPSRGIRPATSEEIIWYNRCFEQNTFIPLEEINLDISPKYEIY